MGIIRSKGYRKEYMTLLSKLHALPEYLTYDDVLLLPNYSDVLPAEVRISAKISEKLTLETPIIASPMDTVCEARMAIEIGRLGGMGIIHRNLKIEEQAKQVTQVVEAGYMAAAAIGVGGRIQERSQALVEAGVSALCVDSAHAHSKGVIETVAWLKKSYPKILLIAGNVATYDGAKALFAAGAKVIKVGMGPGSICTTRVMSGMGVPQLSAVVEAVRAAQEVGGIVIADGGIRASGDIVKALAAGADAVMLGSLLAGTDEAPGEVVQIDGTLYKSYRGMGSIGAMKRGSASRYSQKWGKDGSSSKRLVPEGVEGLVPHRGSLEDHLFQLMGGLRAGMGYLGAANLTELREKAQFIRISSTAWVESRPHSIVVK
jgi:IMP dehydrogenase